MKRDNISKLYDSMTNQERAILAFHHLTELNTQEIERIAASAPVKTYRGCDLEFSKGLDRLMDMASYWSIERWKMEAARWAAVAHFLSSDKPEALEAAQMAESKLIALDEALEAVCAEMGILPADARKMAGIGPVDALSSQTKPDAEYLERNRRELLRIATGWEVEED